MRHLSNCSIILDECPCMDNDKEDCDHERKVGRKEKSKKGIKEIKELWSKQKDGEKGQGEEKQSIIAENLSFANIPEGKCHHVIDNETMAQTTGQGKSRTVIQASRLVSSWF